MLKRLGCIAALAGLAMAGPSIAADGQSATSSGRITMESYTWGRLQWRWMVNADGSGEFTSGNPQTVTQHWDASPSHYREMVELLSPIEVYAGRKLPCTDAISDLPYGTVTWTRDGKDQVVNFDLGCRSTEVDKLYSQMGVTYALVSKWTASASANKPAAGR